uniref:PX n=1 Tax=Zoothera dauma adenovirus TaxID=3073259 RepID=A0AA51RHQ6_9ADEN|nr:pX [Zoothera dauma adenovirus]
MQMRRVSVNNRYRKRKRRTLKSGSKRYRKMRGGFLSLLAPIIAAAVGAAPAIASTVIAAKQAKK